MFDGFEVLLAIVPAEYSLEPSRVGVNNGHTAVNVSITLLQKDHQNRWWFE